MSRSRMIAKLVACKALLLLSLVAGFASQSYCGEESYPLPNAKADRPKLLEKAPWLRDLDALGDKEYAWQTKYDSSAKETAYSRARIVSYAGRWSRHNYGGHGGGGCAWRYSFRNDFAGSLGMTKVEWDKYMTFDRNVDVDGDGDTSDDFVASLPFSMEVPYCIADWPQSSTFPERLSARFYGGVTWKCGNNNTDRKQNFSLEEGINCDHSPPFRDDRAEDHPINGVKHPKIPGSFLKHYVTMLWKKEDFLCNGDKFRVSFDDNSRLATFCTRGYWYGWNDVRFVVQNDGKLYITKKRDDVPDLDFKTAAKQGKPTGYLPICYPTKDQWAEYKPSGNKIDVDDTGVTYKKMEFKNIQAVGWYIAKTDNSTAQTHCKWYGFECDAVINSPQEPSGHIEMKEIKASDVPPFNIATTELPYLFWKKIWKYGDSSSHILEARYLYEKSGSMGSMTFGEKEHEQNEPVTDLTFYDALAAANTLSEMEGKVPCYYTDSECKTVFRNQHLSTLTIKGASWLDRNKKNDKRFYLPTPTIYVKWAAAGHRLPTVAEWVAAAGSLTRAEVTDGTKPVASGKACANGLYEMSGNVWEYCWTFGDSYDPARDEAVTALGGDFSGESPEKNTASPYGFKPYKGAGNIGIRFVCRDAGLGAPKMGDVASVKVQAWSFKQNTIVGKKQEAKPVSEPVLDMVSIPAGTFKRHDKVTIKVADYNMARFTTTYSKWKKVKFWAEANGYTFTKNGDMGSMYFFAFTHSPEEPVTNIPFHDVLVWCNALSEMEGRSPCYYTDVAYTKVHKNSEANMALKVDAWEYIKIKSEKIKILQYISDPNPWLFIRYDTDGYRLPTATEINYAIRGGKTTTYSWGDDESKASDYIWGALNSKGRSHKVGQKKPNPFGLYDIQGNVFEFTSSRLCGKSKRPDRPYALDTDNPVNSVYDHWGMDGKLAEDKKASGYVCGPSYLHGGFNIHGLHGLGVESSSSSLNLSHYYSDLSFRVVRCKPGTHPKDGLRPLSEKPIIKYIEIDKSHFNELSE